MRRLRVFDQRYALDGCCDHRAGSTDEELHRYWAEKLAEADALLFGRVIDEMMEADGVATGDANGGDAGRTEPFARTIDAAKKYVVSSTLERVDYPCVRLFSSLAKLVRNCSWEVQSRRWRWRNWD